MSYPATELIVTYLTSPPTVTNGVTATSTATLPIPSGIDYSQAVKNIFLAGGFWYTSQDPAMTFVPWSQITSISAQ
jgi:hypothetical protein